MKRIRSFLLALTLMCVWGVVNAQSDTTVTSGFTLEEPEITLKIGESHQLRVNPADTKVRWMESWDFSVNPVLIADENGFVTALRAGIYPVVVESAYNVNISNQCQVTVIEEGKIKKDRKSLSPVLECEWKEAKFSLTDEGVFVAEGTFVGSGSQINYLNYVVTDQCIFLSFQIDYADSTMMFYPQPFTLELEGCNAQEYNVYLNNRSQSVASQGKYVRYSITRGPDGTTNVESIAVKKDDGLIYNLKGQELPAIPENGFYIQNGFKHFVR